MPVQALDYYIPVINYNSQAETIRFQERTYAVYTLNKPLSLQKKALVVLRKIGNVFQNKAQQELPHGRTLKAVFINHRAYLLKTTGQESHLALKDTHKDLSQNKEFVLAVTKKSGQAFFYAAHKKLQKDKEFVLAASRQNRDCLHYIPEELKKDKNFVLKAIKLNEHIFQYLPERFKKDKKFILLARKINDKILQYIPEDFKKDKVFMLELVKQNCQALQYAHDDVKQDRKFILEAIVYCYHIALHMHENLKQDKEFLLELIRQNALVLQCVKFKDPLMIEAAHRAIHHRLQSFIEDPQQVRKLFDFASYIIDHQKGLCLHEEHPIVQKAIEVYCLTSQSNDPKNPYTLHATLQKILQEEKLLDDFEGFRKRANKKAFTFADIPDGIVSPQELFETMEQRGVDEEEVKELCCGASLKKIKENILGEGKIVPALLAQKGSKDEPIPLTALYLYFILKSITDADDNRGSDKLSQRESQLLKFASMIKECATGQTDAIEQYYINTIGIGAINRSEEKIEEAIDSGVQMALKKALASDALLKDLIGTIPKQQSHQTLYLKNRYHKQIGLIHNLKFDQHSGVIDSDLIEKDCHETLSIIKQHVHLVQNLKQVFDQVLKGSHKLKITYIEFIAYFEKKFNLDSQHYEDYIEFNEELNPVGITPFAIEKMLMKLGYIQ
jgi:hypothetical protein